MERLIIRVDDVSANTDLYDLNRAAEFLHKELGADIWYCVNIFCKTASGSVHPDLPLRGRPLSYFVDIDRTLGADFCIPSFVEIASHGLIHAEHQNMSDDAQLMSIIMSCKFLKANKFITPFTSWNDSTISICKQNKIEMVDGLGWKSMESEPFDPNHKKWFFHHWRMDYNAIKDYINASKVNA